MKIPEPGESVGRWLHRHRKSAGLVAMFAALGMMLVQLAKPFPEAVNRILIAAFHLTFYPAALVAAYFTFVHRPTPPPHAVEARHTPRAEEFWAEVRRRRRVFFLTWIAWPFVGMTLLKLYSLAFPARDPMVFLVLTLVTWVGVWNWTGHRVTRMVCFQCGHRAFDVVPVFIRRARCGHCGTPYRADERSQDV